MVAPLIISRSTSQEKSKITSKNFKTKAKKKSHTSIKTNEQNIPTTASNIESSVMNSRESKKKIPTDSN